MFTGDTSPFHKALLIVINILRNKLERLSTKIISHQRNYQAVWLEAQPHSVTPSGAPLG
jgi:hypothetical protein